MRRKRQSPAVNAGSMADVAFLLLIFFLVSTQILSDKGVKVILPPYTEKSPPSIGHPGNIFSIWINSADELLVEKKEMDISLLRQAVISYIENPSLDSQNPRSPSKALITINSDQNTSYETYVQVYTELKNAYREIWQKQSLLQYRKPLQELSNDQFNQIKKQFPLKISEVEKYAL